MFAEQMNAFRLRHGLNAAVMAVALILLASCATTHSVFGGKRVLFVGNSVIYTNNLPALFVQLAAHQPGAQSIRVDMLARGGATLTEMAADHNVAEAIEKGRYDVVVFQERGGDDLCVLMDDRDTPDCRALVESHIHLAELARTSGAKVLYLGTYQMHPEVSNALVRAETRLSTQMGAQYLEISERLRISRENDPDLPWIHADKGHPGIGLSVLMADRLYQSVTGRPLLPRKLCTDIVLYQPSWKREGIAEHDELVSGTQTRRCLLTQAEMGAILAAGDTSSSAASAQ